VKPINTRLKLFRKFNLKWIFLSNKNFVDGIVSRAVDMGKFIGVTHAEGFTAERYLAVNSLDDLI